MKGFLTGLAVGLVLAGTLAWAWPGDEFRGDLEKYADRERDSRQLLEQRQQDAERNGRSGFRSPC